MTSQNPATMTSPAVQTQPPGGSWLENGNLSTSFGYFIFMYFLWYRIYFLSELARRATSLTFPTPDDVTTQVLIADKSGDVVTFDLEGAGQPKVILGHVSMLLDVVSSVFVRARLFSQNFYFFLLKSPDQFCHTYVSL